MKKLITTLGSLDINETGMILPHEHVFTDLRNWREEGYAKADIYGVTALMGPELEKAKSRGISVIIESTPVGVGRRVDIVKMVSGAADFPIAVPTGVYREPWMPDWVKNSGIDELGRWMHKELNDQIEETGIQAGWIKLSAGDEGMTKNEARILTAAAEAGKHTNAVIGSHTIKGSVVRAQLDLIEKGSYPADRFIWIHAQAEPDFDLHVEMAKRGAWIEYDSIGSDEQDGICLENILRLLDKGHEDQILISQDRGWYDPAKPKGGIPMPYTYICDVFLPKLRNAGAGEDIIEKITKVNPFNAFSR